jgi:hypothetical protein
MKVSAILFSLLVAGQVLPAAAQTAGMTHAEMADVTRANLADQFGPERLRAEYHFAVARPKLLAGKPLAYTYDFVTDTNIALAGGNAIKSQSKVSYAYDKEGRSRTVSTLPGLERIIIADPTQQAVYLVCPERKEILRMTGAALGSPAVPQAPSEPPAKPNLGEKTIAGVKAVGDRSVVTIPAGAQGNDKPLVHTSETWYSPDLAALVYSHMTMPEFGDIVMHVENLKFGDVPASTFALPEGYAIRDIALHE